MWAKSEALIFAIIFVRAKSEAIVRSSIFARGAENMAAVPAEAAALPVGETAAAVGVAEAASLPETSAPPVERKRGESGMPRHVQPIETKIDGTKFYARLRWLPQGATKPRYDAIPGLQATPEAAAKELALATERYESSGAEAVWPNGLPGSKLRLKRGGRDVAFWQAQQAAQEQQAVERAATKAARDAAQAQRSKRPRKNSGVGDQCASTVLPADRSQVRDPTMRFFLQPTTGLNDKLAQPRAPAPTPVPMPGFARAAADLGVDITAEMGIPSA